MHGAKVRALGEAALKRSKPAEDQVSSREGVAQRVVDLIPALNNSYLVTREQETKTKMRHRVAMAAMAREFAGEEVGLDRCEGALIAELIGLGV